MLNNIIKNSQKEKSDKCSEITDSFSCGCKGMEIHFKRLNLEFLNNLLNMCYSGKRIYKSSKLSRQEILKLQILIENVKKEIKESEDMI